MDFSNIDRKLWHIWWDIDIVGLAETEQIGQVEIVRESELSFLHRDNACVVSFLRDCSSANSLAKTTVLSDGLYVQPMMTV